MNLTTRLGLFSDFVTKQMIYALGRSETTGLQTDQLGVIRGAQLEAIIATSRPMMFANLANVVALLLIQISSGKLWSPTFLWATAVGLFAVSGLRGVHRYNASERKTTAGPRATGKVTLSATILAFVWCYPVLFILPVGTAVEIAFVSALTAGMVAGGALALYPVPLAALVYTSILSMVAFIAIVFSGTLPMVPFAIVIAGFSFVVMHSVLRQSGMFLSELVGKLDARRQRDLTELLVDTYQGKGGHYLWRCDATTQLTTDPASLHEMLGLPNRQASDKSLLELLKIVDAYPLIDDSQRIPLESFFPKNCQVDLILRLNDGRTIKFVGRPEKLVSETPSGYLGYIKDVTVETIAASEIHRLATRDTMTGLLNYQEFRIQAEAVTADKTVPGKQIVYLFIDADNLKTINDNFGHASGDRLILEIAARLKKNLPSGSLVARKGGDEFVALFQTNDQRNLSSWSTRFQESMCENLETVDLKFPVSCCIGISHADPLGLNLCNLELEADRALYEAKSRGKRQVQIYNNDIGEKIRRQRMLASDLEIAINQNELSLAFQPIFSTKETALVGSEALLRWKHPIYGDIAPQTVVAIANADGLSMALLNFVLSSAISTVASSPAYGFLSVNVTSTDLQRHDFAAQVLDTLWKCNFSPARLWLEVTESEALHQLDDVRINLRKLRTAGVKIAIDDFGSGYSNLSSIVKIPADVIKIDRLLVSNCNVNKRHQVVLKAVKSIADLGGLEVVAEGAETIQEVTFLKTIGFGMIQGFALARPISGQAFSKLLSDNIQDGGKHASIKVVA